MSLPALCLEMSSQIGGNGVSFSLDASIDIFLLMGIPPQMSFEASFNIESIPTDISSISMELKEIIDGALAFYNILNMECGAHIGSIVGAISAMNFGVAGLVGGVALIVASYATLIESIASNSQINLPAEEAGRGRTLGSLLAVAAFAVFDLYLIIQILKRFFGEGALANKFGDAYRAVGEGILKRLIKSEAFWSIAHPTILTLIYYGLFWYMIFTGKSGYFWSILRGFAIFVENLVLGRVTGFQSKIALIRGLINSTKITVCFVPRHQLPVIMGLVGLFLLINTYYGIKLFSRIAKLL